jgi:hypothetical protein
MQQIVIEDNLLKEYYKFKNGQSDTPQLLERLLIYFKPYLTNVAQLKRIGQGHNNSLLATLSASGYISQDLSELTKFTSLKFILSENNSDYPYININNDIFKTDFTATVKKEPCNKVILSIKALCENANKIYIYDKYLKENSNSAKKLSRLFPEKELSIIYHADQLNQDIISSWKSYCSHWSIKKDRTNKYSKFHDRYLIIDDTVEIILTGGFDKLFDDDYDSTYIFRLLK